MTIEKYFQALTALLNKAPENLLRYTEHASDSAAGVMAGYFVFCETQPETKRPFKAGDAINFVKREGEAVCDKVNMELEARENAAFLLRTGDPHAQGHGEAPGGGAAAQRKETR